MERIITDEQIKYEMAVKRVKKIKKFYSHLVVYILVNIFLLCLQYMELEEGESFLQFKHFRTTIFWGFGLIIHGFVVFGKEGVFGREWEERKIREIMEKDKQNSSQNWE